MSYLRSSIDATPYHCLQKRRGRVTYVQPIARVSRLKFTGILPPRSLPRRDAIQRDAYRDNGIQLAVETCVRWAAEVRERAQGGHIPGPMSMTHGWDQARRPRAVDHSIPGTCDAVFWIAI